MYIRWEDFVAYVRNVIDGDTITVERGSLVLTVRIAHIDAPESGQELANESRDLLRKLCYQKFVHVHPIGSDRYSRIIAEIRTENNLDCSAELIRQGLAWWLQGKKRDENYGLIEQAARENRVGLHALRNVEKPWNYRKNTKRIKTK